LLELEEEVKDDETERRVREYYEQRLEEQKRQASRARFGRVYPIGRDDYTREVTDASKVNEPGDGKEQGTGVVCFLYKDGCVSLLIVPSTSDQTRTASPEVIEPLIKLSSWLISTHARNLFLLSEINA